MIVRYMFIIFMLLIQSCANRENNNFEENYEEISIVPFTKIAECIDVTTSFIKNWRDNGGKIESTILQMRKHIENDDKSKFSSLVKSAWKSQERSGFYEDNKNIGTWPVNKNKFSIVTGSYLFSDKNELGECGALAMWNEFMREEFTLDKNDIMIPRLLEFPSSIEWVYPDNMLWLKYWIFVNIKTND